MSEKKNFLLGRGERLTEWVTVPSGSGPKTPPYSFTKARSRLAKRVKELHASLSALPDDACPNGEAVAVMTLHPRYISKSDFPSELMRDVGLRSIGSRPRTITPERWGIARKDGPAATSALFVAGPRASYAAWSETAPNWSELTPSGAQLTRIEDISAYLVEDKIRGIDAKDGLEELALEMVLHDGGVRNMVPAFEAFAESHGAILEKDRIRQVDGLWFVPARCARSSIRHLAEFSFLRVVRRMPKLRMLRPISESTKSKFSASVSAMTLRTSDVPKVAIFDGGLPDDHKLHAWVNYYEPAGIGRPEPDFVTHGLHVTSAYLFGSLSRGCLPPTPMTRVDHHRVLDEHTRTMDFDLIDVLDRITEVLKRDEYEYVNLSLGPDIPVEDDEVTLWTSSLDSIFATHARLLTVAAGNSGDMDPDSGLNRVQPPGDAVNALCVGAADSVEPNWSRAAYSSVGPGRSPGVIKPDGLAFGGSEGEPFWVFGASLSHLEATVGTSFAAPLVARAAAGVGALMGDRLHPLAIRTLLIHRTEKSEDVCPHETGWGRFITDVDELVTSADNEVHVVYQGELPVGQHLRARIPLPACKPSEMIDVRATLCISPHVDSAHPFSYTRGGLEVVFRPHADKYTIDDHGKVSKHPKTTTFFSAKREHRHASELELREQGKWETVRSSHRRFRASSLKEPCFDIYYHTRVNGSVAQDRKPLPYGLVVTVRAKKSSDFYNRVVREYSHVLQQLRPTARLPLEASITN